MTTVVTSWGPKGWTEYGQRFCATWKQYWPTKVRLVAYVEDDLANVRRAELRRLFDLEPCKAFIDKHRDDPRANGRAPLRGWREKERIAGYSYRTDAVKFCRKVYALANAARLARAEGETVLAWIDADVVSLRPIPDGFIENLLGKADYAYLGRAPAHSECGFMAFRLPECLPLLDAMQALYDSGDLFKLPQTHDSFVFDVVRSEFREIRGRDLTPGGSAHVWVQSPLAAYLDHCKGDRKALGYSPERIYPARRRVA